jgi:hypothetical protein
MQERGVDYVAADGITVGGCRRPGPVLRTPRSCAPPTVSQIQTLGQVGLQCEFNIRSDSASNGR